MSAVFYWVADWSLSRGEAIARLGSVGSMARDMGDATHGSVAHLAASSLPVVAGYVTGTPDIDWTAQDFARFSGRTVVTIDQANAIRVRAEVADVEPGAMVPKVAAEQARARFHEGSNFTGYVDESELPALEQAIADAGLPKGHIIGYQYASPSSNPRTLLPGTKMTLREANIDLSVVVPIGPFGPPHHNPPITPPLPRTPKPDKALRAVVEVDPDTNTWQVHHENPTEVAA